MGRDADPAAAGDRQRQGQALAGGRPLQERHVGLGLGQVPEAGQLPGVEHRTRPGRRDRSQVPQVAASQIQAAGHEAVAGGQAELAVGRGEPVQAGLDLGPGSRRPGRRPPGGSG